MSPEIILGAIVVVPVVLLLVLRVNATLVFLSLCLGSVLVQFVGSDPESVTSWISVTQGASEINIDDATLKLILLLAPVILTTIFMIKTIKDNSRMILNILPSIGVGMLGALLVVPLLPFDISQEIVDSSLWGEVLKVQNVIVGATALVCLLVLWLQRPKTGGDKHKKHH